MFRNMKISSKSKLIVVNNYFRRNIYVKNHHVDNCVYIYIYEVSNMLKPLHVVYVCREEALYKLNKLINNINMRRV